MLPAQAANMPSPFAIPQEVESLAFERDMPSFAGKARWKIEPEMAKMLEEAFGISHYPSRDARVQLAKVLQVTERQVQVWFQNRRQREKRGGDEASSEPYAPSRVCGSKRSIDAPKVHEQGPLHLGSSPASPPPLHHETLHREKAQLKAQVAVDESNEGLAVHRPLPPLPVHRPLPSWSLQRAVSHDSPLALANVIHTPFLTEPQWSRPFRNDLGALAGLGLSVFGTPPVPLPPRAGSIDAACMAGMGAMRVNSSEDVVRAIAELEDLDAVLTGAPDAGNATSSLPGEVQAGMGMQTEVDTQGAQAQAAAFEEQLDAAADLAAKTSRQTWSSQPCAVTQGVVSYAPAISGPALPNPLARTLEGGAVQPSSLACKLHAANQHVQVVVGSTSPHLVLWASDAWLKQWGFAGSEVTKHDIAWHGIGGG